MQCEQFLPFFKNLSFFKYWVFFEADTCTQQLLCGSRIGFQNFFRTLIFDLNWPFSKGYSPRIVTNFKNSCHFFNIRSSLQPLFAQL